MNKKVFSAVLSSAISLSILVGCDNVEGNKQDNNLVKEEEIFENETKQEIEQSKQEIEQPKQEGNTQENSTEEKGICYICGIELPVSKMYYSGRSYRCESCYEEEYNTEVLSENEQQQLDNSQQYAEPGYEADHCEHCGSSNIETMDNAGGYICNECGGM